jgi:hypothetical protein
MAVSSTSGGRIVYRCLGGFAGANAPIPHCQHAVPRIAADRAVLDQVVAVLEPFSDPDRLPGLRLAWRERTAPKTDSRNRRLAELERALAASQRRPTAAGRILLDESLGGRQANWRTYELVRDEEVKAIEAIEAECARLVSETSSAVEKRPSLDQILVMAGGWASILDGVDASHQRSVLEPLVELVQLKRVGWGKYVAEINWTDLGQSLLMLTKQLSTLAA